MKFLIFALLISSVGAQASENYDYEEPCSKARREYSEQMKKAVELHQELRQLQRDAGVGHEEAESDGSEYNSEIYFLKERTIGMDKKTLELKARAEKMCEGRRELCD